MVISTIVIIIWAMPESKRSVLWELVPYGDIWIYDEWYMKWGGAGNQLSWKQAHIKLYQCHQGFLVIIIIIVEIMMIIIMFIPISAGLRVHHLHHHHHGNDDDHHNVHTNISRASSSWWWLWSNIRICGDVFHIDDAHVMTCPVSSRLQITTIRKVIRGFHQIDWIHSIKNSIISAISYHSATIFIEADHVTIFISDATAVEANFINKCFTLFV